MSQLFHRCPVCTRDSVIDEYQAAVVALFDLQDLDFQLIHLIFDTFHNKGSQEERDKRCDEIMSKWKIRNDEAKARIYAVRDCYLDTLQAVHPTD